MISSPSPGAPATSPFPEGHDHRRGAVLVGERVAARPAVEHVRAGRRVGVAVGQRVDAAAAVQRVVAAAARERVVAVPARQLVGPRAAVGVHADPGDRQQVVAVPQREPDVHVEGTAGRERVDRDARCDGGERRDWFSGADGSIGIENEPAPQRPSTEEAR